MTEIWPSKVGSISGQHTGLVNWFKDNKRARVRRRAPPPNYIPMYVIPIAYAALLSVSKVTAAVARALAVVLCICLRVCSVLSDVHDGLTRDDDRRDVGGRPRRGRRSSHEAVRRYPGDSERAASASDSFLCERPTLYKFPSWNSHRRSRCTATVHDVERAMTIPSSASIGP